MGHIEHSWRPTVEIGNGTYISVEKVFTTDGRRVLFCGCGAAALVERYGLWEPKIVYDPATHRPSPDPIFDRTIPPAVFHDWAGLR